MHDGPWTEADSPPPADQEDCYAYRCSRIVALRIESAKKFDEELYYVSMARWYLRDTISGIREQGWYDVTDARVTDATHWRDLTEPELVLAADQT